jgi:ABC-2 type transport system permease protein
MTRVPIWTRTVRDQRRALIGWSLGIAALVFVMALVWPTVRDMKDIQKFLDNYPEALRKLFRLDSYGTGSGYLNSELYSLMVPAIFLVFSIARGARLVAGEEEDGTLDVLVCTAPSRGRVVLEQAGALATVTVVLSAALFAATLVASWAVSMDVAILDLVRGTVAMAVLALEYGFVAFAVGAATGRRGLAIGVSTALAVAAYVLYVLGQLVHGITPWRGFSSFSQALDRGPVGPTWPPGLLAMIGVAAAATIVGVVVFDRRDLHR